MSLALEAVARLRARHPRSTGTNYHVDLNVIERALRAVPESSGLALKGIIENAWRTRWAEIYPNLVPAAPFHTIMLVLESLAADPPAASPVEGLDLRAIEAAMQCEEVRLSVVPNARGLFESAIRAYITAARPVPEPREAAIHAIAYAPLCRECLTRREPFPHCRACALIKLDHLRRAGDAGAPHPEPALYSGPYGSPPLGIPDDFVLVNLRYVSGPLGDEVRAREALERDTP